VFDRRSFLRMIAAALSAKPFAARGQQRATPWRIGVLVAGGASGINPLESTVAQALGEAGYVDGKDVIYVGRSADGRIERLPQLAAELVRLGVDVIVTGGSEATRAAKDATTSVPIVFFGPSYPVEEGLVATFARPGGNITGITVAMSDTVSKHLQLLREVAPMLADVAVVWSPANPGHRFAFRDTEREAASSRLKIHSVPILSPGEVDAAFARIERVRPGALIVQPLQQLPYPVQRLAELAVRLRVPSITIAKTLAQEGLLMSYGAVFADAPRRVAGYVERILKGASPAALPVERPTRFELVINMKTARAMGLAIPQSLVLRANELIE
jgi:ABC-type uncharacterized transport system substrate-binding protein